jgi:hypothetical protein
VNGSKTLLHLLHLAKAPLTVLHGNAVAERGFCVNTALQSKDRMLLDETTIQGTRLVNEIIRLHGQPTAVPMTQSMISAVQLAHSKYLIYVEREKQDAAAEVV